MIPVDNTTETGASGAARDTFEQAVAHHRAGRLEDARMLYRRILASLPEHPDALHMLGVLSYQAGRYDEAVALMQRAGRFMQGNAGYLINLGNVLQAMGRLDDATAAFRDAIRLSPDNAIAYNNLGNALRLLGNHGQSIEALKKAVDIDSHYSDAYVNLAISYQASNDTENAMRCYQQAIGVDPGNRSAAHMLAALRGEITQGTPPDHVIRLFDEYAARFDHHLVDVLGYAMPGMLRDEIDRLLGGNAHFRNVIDLGCGTGLAGMAFRSISGHIAGVDLSQRMIDRARERNVYDDLKVGDVVSMLLESRVKYDLVICADVFPYIGDARPLFSAVSSHSGPGSLFAFSTELHTGRNYILQPTGRYAHSQDYLRTLAAAHGFSVLTMRTGNLRKQKDLWIQGDLVVMRKTG